MKLIKEQDFPKGKLISCHPLSQSFEIISMLSQIQTVEETQGAPSSVILTL